MSNLPDMPLLSISSSATIDKCLKLPTTVSDIFICSYPKSGTTWMQHIVISLLLLHREKSGCHLPALSYEHVSDFAPFFEIDSHWNENELIPPIQNRHNQLGRRLFNTHLRGDMLPGGTPKKCKFIYIHRSPLDACVSFYHHLSHQHEGCYEKSLNEFFDEWIAGKLPFGTWSDHILSYASLVANGEVFLLSYEDMVGNLEESVDKLAKFLELDDCLTSQDVKSILPLFSFSIMKKDLNKFQPKSVTWKKDFNFLRKGVVGDEKETLSDEQRLRFKAHLDSRYFSKEIKEHFKDKHATFDSKKFVNRLIGYQ
jgi:hypothetical protein